MIGKPYQSCLIPHENEIISLRRKKPPVPYSQIAALLREKYQVIVCREAVYRFLKDRAKKDSITCKYAWGIKQPETNNQPEARVIETPAKPSVPNKPFQMKETFIPPKLSDYGWDDLTKPYKEKLSPEDRAILLKIVQEKERNRK